MKHSDGHHAVECSHWSDCGLRGAGCCRLSRFGGRPSFGACRVCIASGDNHPTGLGDSIALALNATGAAAVAKRAVAAMTRKPCRCAGRQAALNRLLPYRAKPR